MTFEEIEQAVLKKYPDLKPDPLALDLTFMVPVDRLISCCTFLKEDEQLYFDNLMCLTVVDNVDNMEVVVHLSSYKNKHRLTLKVGVIRENPRVPTLTGLWPGADWHEREAYDLYGVIFEGHPDLRRILLPDDWEGYPMRKGYTHWNLTPLPEDLTEVVKDYPGVAPPIR